MKEVILSKGSFGKAKELSGKLAIIKQILNLILMQKNTHPSDKDMGVDIESYLHEFADQNVLSSIKQEISSQILKYTNIQLLDVEPTFVAVSNYTYLAVQVKFKYGNELTGMLMNFEDYNKTKQVKLFTN